MRVEQYLVGLEVMSLSSVHDQSELHLKLVHAILQSVCLPRERILECFLKVLFYLRLYQLLFFENRLYRYLLPVVLGNSWVFPQENILLVLQVLESQLEW